MICIYCKIYEVLYGKYICMRCDYVMKKYYSKK